AENPEGHGAIDKVHGDARAGEDKQRGQDDDLGADEVIDKPANECTKGCRDISCNAEDEHVPGVESVHGNAQDGAEGEYTSKTIAEDGRGKEEVAGITVNLPELFDIPKELDVGVFDASSLVTRWGDFRYAEESRQGGQAKPRSGKHRDQADIEPAFGADAE